MELSFKFDADACATRSGADCSLSQRTVPTGSGRRTVGEAVKQALKQLLHALDEISKTHAEVSDTAAREVMALAVHRGFVLGEKGLQAPGQVRDVQRGRQPVGARGASRVPRTS